MPISQGKPELKSSNVATKVAGSPAARSVALKAPLTNTATVYVGGHGVTSTTGLPMEPGDVISVDGGGLEDLYFTGTAGDSLSWLAAA